MNKILSLLKKGFYMLVAVCSFSYTNAQTSTATITQSGWYRIAINGPLVTGGKGGNRAAARFILRDATSSLHQTVEFLAYEHYGKRPSIVVLNNSHYGGTPPFIKIRIITGGTYEGAAIDVYIHIHGSNHEAYFLQDNDQISGWSAVNWQQVSTLSGDNDGVPSGFNAYVIHLKNVVKGFVGSGGKQLTYTNGNFYTSGNIGIGTTNPQSKLAVNGTVTAQKVKVTQTGWPDDVFDSTYLLQPLSELKKYIHKNKHLPDIPSAGEIIEKGNDLGATDVLLLKKIEELTLYLIEMKEIQKTQRKQIEELKAEIRHLKKIR